VIKKRKLGESLIEGIIKISGTVSTITVLLIIVFLFREGLSLFSHSPIEDGFVVSISKQNPLNKLTPEEIKNIFDQKITNWKEIGGKNDSIILFTADDIGKYYTEEELGAEFEHLSERINDFVAKTPGVIAFFSKKYIPANFAGKEPQTDRVKVMHFLAGKEWFPTAQPAAQLGVLPLILGTLWVSLGAIAIALPFGLATAVYMAEIADSRVRKILKPIIELLAGIPSVVYGFFGLVIIVPLIQKMFNLPVGETALAGSIILGIMALPTVITISEDAIRTTPRAMKEASLALGATHWQTIIRVIIPYSSSGITAGAILGIGRAIGETMAVLMVTGNAAVIPGSILEPVRTIPATIAAELGEAPHGGLHYKALFTLGCILFLITLIINFSVEFISGKKKTSKL
jgi:phosphate transport system permease protein